MQYEFHPERGNSTARILDKFTRFSFAIPPRSSRKVLLAIRVYMKKLESVGGTRGKYCRIVGSFFFESKASTSASDGRQGFLLFDSDGMIELLESLPGQFYGN
jgi:hypothetical protein